MGKKIKVTFIDYSNELVSLVGMQMNGLVRKICEEQGAKPVRSTFLTPENATPDWLIKNIEWQVAVALMQRPKETRTVTELAREVAVVYEEMIGEWIEDNKANLAEIGFLFAPPDAAPVAMQQMAQPVAVPAPGTISAIVCRRGKR